MAYRRIDPYVVFGVEIRDSHSPLTRGAIGNKKLKKSFRGQGSAEGISFGCLHDISGGINQLEPELDVIETNILPKNFV